MTRLPWGHKSRHCAYCRKVGPRTHVLGGWAHKRCLPREERRRIDRENRQRARGPKAGEKVLDLMAALKEALK